MITKEQSDDWRKVFGVKVVNGPGGDVFVLSTPIMQCFFVATISTSTI